MHKQRRDSAWPLGIDELAIHCNAWFKSFKGSTLRIRNAVSMKSTVSCANCKLLSQITL